MVTVTVNNEQRATTVTSPSSFLSGRRMTRVRFDTETFKEQNYPALKERRDWRC